MCAFWNMMEKTCLGDPPSSTRKKKTGVYDFTPSPEDAKSL
jgi:hypothetical protein